MTNTVALISATGLLGSGIYEALKPLHAKGAIKLIVVHRPSTHVRSLPDGAEARPLDFNTATEEDVHKALAGADIVLNATGRTDADAETRFIDHLATLPGLRRYIPSEFSPGYTPDEAKASGSPLLAAKEKNTAHARTRGIPQTLIQTGVFEPFLFVPVFTGFDLSGPSVSVHGASRERKLPVTSVPYLATALGELVQRDPRSLADTYTIVEYGVSSNDAIAALEKVTGKKVTVTEHTAKDVEEVRAKGPVEALASTTRAKWGAGGWPAENPFNPEGVPRGNFQAAVENALKTEEAKA